MPLKYSTTSSDRRIVTGFLSFEAYGFLRDLILEKSYSVFMLSTWVERALTLGCLTRGDQTKNITRLTLAVTYNEQLCARTHSKEQESIFVGGVVIIEELHCEIIIKNALGLFKRDAMLPGVGSGLDWIPLESHAYIVLFELPRSSSEVRQHASLPCISQAPGTYEATTDRHEPCSSKLFACLCCGDRACIQAVGPGLGSNMRNCATCIDIRQALQRHWVAAVFQRCDGEGVMYREGGNLTSGMIY